MNYIIINHSHTVQFQFFQVLATVRNMADGFSRYILLKIISFIWNKKNS